MKRLVLAFVNAALRLPWGHSSTAEWHRDHERWVLDRDARYTARWRRRLGIWQWKLLATSKARHW